MNDLISRQATIKAFKDLPNTDNGFSGTYDKAQIIGVLEELPSAQPDIVHCRECQYNDEPPADDKTVWCCYMDVTMMENDFCSKGERREDG